MLVIMCKMTRSPEIKTFIDRFSSFIDGSVLMAPRRGLRQTRALKEYLLVGGRVRSKCSWGAPRAEGGESYPSVVELAFGTRLQPPALSETKPHFK